MKFMKMQGLGNDYVYIDCFRHRVDNPGELAVRVSNRHFGVGSDGLILICPSDKGQVRMDMYNADGSRSQMCGNGARCVAKYAYDHGYVASKNFLLETLGGMREVTILREEEGKAKLIGIDMGKPVLKGALPEDIEILGKKEQFIGVDMGNPHAVYFVSSREELEGLELSVIGPAYENHPRFPERVNSEFVFVKDKENLYMRVWERGSGETLACGSGAGAAAFGAMQMGYCGSRVNMHLLGGTLVVFRDEKGSIVMEGPAEYVFSGELFW